MKEFPYAQRIIWENDVEQIEWHKEKLGNVWYSADYIAKTHPRGSATVGVWRKIDDVLLFITDGVEYYAEELECWAKLQCPSKGK